MCVTWTLWIFPPKIMEGVSVLKDGHLHRPFLELCFSEITLLISGNEEAGLLDGSATVKVNVLSFSKVNGHWKCLQNYSSSCRGVFKKLTACNRVSGFAFLWLRRTGFWAAKVIYALIFLLLWYMLEESVNIEKDWSYFLFSPTELHII